MVKSKSLLVFSFMLVVLVALFIVYDQTPAAATGTKPTSGNPSLQFTPGEARTGGISQLPAMAPGVVLVGLKPGVTASMGRLGVQSSDASLTAALAEFGVQGIESVFANAKPSSAVASTDSEIDLSRIYRLRLAPDADILRTVQALDAHPAVAYAEPDYLAHLIATPDDPLYPEQWGLAQIDAPAAWDVVTGTADVVVAVVDAGLDTLHPDLADQVWANPGEIAGNGVDDDSNGYVDDIHGWNMVDDNADLSDNTGHGTQVAGVVAAATDNGEGVAGVCWTCRLMIVKVTQPGGVANYSHIAAGVAYAAQKGAEVINLSLGGYSDSATLRAAIAAAAQTAVVVGGSGNDNKSAPLYPAAYDDAVLAVAGTTSADTKVGTSNYGAWVDVAAPGEAITTTFSGGGYGPTSGTSMAAPFAAGLAALLRSQHAAWTPDMVRAQIIHTADDIDVLNPGYAGLLGSGRIDAQQAVTTAAQPVLRYASHAVDGEPAGRPEPGSTVDLDVTLTNDWADATNVQATLSTSDAYAAIVTGTAAYGDMAAYASRTNTTPFRFSVSGSAPFAHDIAFTLHVAADGSYAMAAPFTVTLASGMHTVGGPLTSDETWNADQIHIVTSSVLVPNGIALTIEPGAEVRFDSGRYLQVEGTLRAMGTVEQEILFTSNQSSPSVGDWDGIRFEDSSVDADCVVSYARLEYASLGISISQASPAVHDNVIVNCHTGISASGIDSPVSHNVFDGCRMDLVDADITVSENLFIGHSAGLYCDLGVIPDVVSNTFHSNHRAVVVFGDDAGRTLRHNNFVDNAWHVFMENAVNDVNAAYNWWGTTSVSSIETHLYDALDDFNLGRVNYTPVLDAPEPTAPAYLYDVTLSPASPVGIEAVTFELTFSRPMDLSVDPAVAFGATEPYTTYWVVDNTEWLDPSHWRATYDVTSLVPRGTYTLSVSTAKGTDGMEIPTDIRFGFTVDYAGEITDQTPPSAPRVIAGGKEGDPSTVVATWSASDPDSSITGYRYAIGSAAGAVDIVNWTNTSSTSLTRSGLGLVEGRQYWLAVQARNEGGLWSASGHSAFVAGQPLRQVFLPVVLRRR